MKKFKLYTGKILTGYITIKLDGVQAVCKDGVWPSRNAKPLHNLPVVEDGIYEYFRVDWNTSISDVKTHNGTLLDVNSLYRLDETDKRLLLTDTIELTPEHIKTCFNDMHNKGFEGLVIVTDKYFYKVKNKETHDVSVIGYQGGTNKHTGKMGALITASGKVGTGFTDKQREEYTKDFILGKTIEVSCMSITKDGKFRHPVFVRLREDK